MALVDPIITFLNIFRTSLENLLLYPVGSPAVETQFKNFRRACRDMTRAQGNLELEYRDALLHINGKLQPRKVLAHPLVRWLQKLLHDRQITKLTISPGATVEEVLALARIFNLDPKRFSDSDEGQIMLDNAGVTQIRFNDFQQEQHAGAQDPKPQFDFFGPASTGPGSLPADPVFTVREKRSGIEMSSQEEHTLKHNVLDLIREGKLDKVAKSLLLICRDLHASDRHLQEMGAASYRVVVDTLIQEKLDRPLIQVQKGVFRDLDQIDEVDVFAYHLDSLHRIIDFFKHAVLLHPMLDGLAWLAGGRQQYPKNKRNLIQSLLFDFLDEPTVDMLIRHIETNSRYKAKIEKLLLHHGSAFVPPFLQVLYKTDNRALRHAIIRQLQRMGPAIQPDLLKELKRHIDDGGPWFVKRNLLQLLSEQPPVDMVGLLEALVAEGQPKLFDLVNRCLFRIHHREAYALGRRLLKTSSESEQIKILAHMSSGKLKAYSDTLIVMAQGDGSEELKTAAIKALGRLDSPEGITCLTKILANKPIFAGKAQENLRAAAAEGLSHCSSPQAQQTLAQFAGDRNKTVRHFASRVRVRQ